MKQEHGVFSGLDNLIVKASKKLSGEKKKYDKQNQVSFTNFVRFLLKQDENLKKEFPGAYKRGTSICYVAVSSTILCLLHSASNGFSKDKAKQILASALVGAIREAEQEKYDNSTIIKKALPTINTILEEFSKDLCRSDELDKQTYQLKDKVKDRCNPESGLDNI